MFQGNVSSGHGGLETLLNRYGLELCMQMTDNGSDWQAVCRCVCVADTQTTGQTGPGWPARLSDMPDRQRQQQRPLHWPITLSHCQTTTTVPGRAVLGDSHLSSCVALCVT